jgi:hypothetical protein
MKNPISVSTHRDKRERPFGLADPAPHGGIAVKMKAALMRERTLILFR